MFQAYNITNDDPIYFWEFMRRIITGLGYPAPKYNLPYWLVVALAVILQFVCKILKPIKEIRPTFTPMTVALAGTHHFYSCERAKNDMDYKPVVPMDKAIKLAIDSYPELRAET